jgi:hypothetical protein
MFLLPVGLAGLPLLSDQAIFAVAQNCFKNLMRIDIGDNSVITDASTCLTRVMFETVKGLICQTYRCLRAVK